MRDKRGAPVAKVAIHQPCEAFVKLLSRFNRSNNLEVICKLNFYQHIHILHCFHNNVLVSNLSEKNQKKEREQKLLPAVGCWKRNARHQLFAPVGAFRCHLPSSFPRNSIPILHSSITWINRLWLIDFPISFPFGIDLVCFLLFAISNDVDRPEQSCSIAESNAPGERIPLAHSWLRPSNYAYRQLSSAWPLSSTPIPLLDWNHWKRTDWSSALADLPSDFHRVVRLSRSGTEYFKMFLLSFDYFRLAGSARYLVDWFIRFTRSALLEWLQPISSDVKRRRWKLRRLAARWVSAANLYPRLCHYYLIHLFLFVGWLTNRSCRWNSTFFDPPPPSLPFPSTSRYKSVVAVIWCPINWFRRASILILINFTLTSTGSVIIAANTHTHTIFIYIYINNLFILWNQQTSSVLNSYMHI